jgi:signal-transduction protein with cAMP-binding, CBS, and nucleotidyltransferase domain
MNKKLKRSEYDDLASNLYLKSFKGLDKVIDFGQSGDEFFIIISGVVNVLVPDYTSIPDFGVKWKDYKILKEWKETVFDLRALKI